MFGPFPYPRYAQLESLAVLPRWAQDTLAAHAADPRVVKTQEQLEHGTTGASVDGAGTWGRCRASPSATRARSLHGVTCDGNTMHVF